MTALDRAAAAGAVRRDLPIYITEFGVQSYPNPVVGVPLAQQAEFDAIGEQIAWSNPRVASFSQYLLHDDHPVGGRVVGFQSGIETYSGAHKPLYNGFRLPLTVTRTPGGVVALGARATRRRPDDADRAVLLRRGPNLAWPRDRAHRRARRIGPRPGVSSRAAAGAFAGCRRPEPCSPVRRSGRTRAPARWRHADQGVCGLRRAGVTLIRVHAGPGAPGSR